MTATQPGTEIAPIRKVASVPQPPEEAFRLFTDEMAAWWPLASHSVGLAATDVVFEQGEGGRILESIAGGRSEVWGTVILWDRPRGSGSPGTPAPRRPRRPRWR